MAIDSVVPSFLMNSPLVGLVPLSSIVPPLTPPLTFNWFELPKPAEALTAKSRIFSLLSQNNSWPLVPWKYVSSLKLEIPETFRVPSTSKVDVGCAEPIPILPLASENT